MADLTPKTIGELPEATSLSVSDAFPISSGGASKKTLWSTIKAAVQALIDAKFPVSVQLGGTGATTAAGARENLEIPKVIQYGTDGIWTYHKYDDGTYHAWYEGNINMGAGSAFMGGYFHQSSSGVTPPSFSTAVTSLVGAANGALLYAYVGHATDYSTYWANSASSSATNIPVRLDMYGTWGNS